ncbi:MAG: peptidoglycan DD-metalloendopeptidase family protein [Acidobacteria bacterium]|nr:peptidoglycan DD-metalloendopeptidase family protein [Acidobacteriota bacterium]
MPSTLLTLALVTLVSGGLEAAQGVYRVRRGDNAARIAKVHGLSMAQLQTLNPGLTLSKLSIGQTVTVKRNRPGQRPAPAPPVEVEVVHGAALAVPVATLPGWPQLGPSVLPHLERVLPAQTRLLAPEGHSESSLLDLRGREGANLAVHMKPVVPEAGPEILPARTQPFEPADPANLDLLWPVQTRTVSSSWGPRVRTRVVRVKQSAKKKRVRYRGSHKGVDLTAPVGTDVYATMDGEVVAVGRHRQYGNFVVLDHGNGVSTLYAHHKGNFVAEGDIVRRGQKIAEVGRTGNATGPHLHFELRIQGERRNPLPLLNDVEEIPAELVAENAAATAPSRR